jgi:hypothetical protein
MMAPTFPRSSAFPTGESPFHMKGSLWLGVRQFVEGEVHGGVPEVSRHLEPAQRDFFTQLFLAAGWYDVLPIVPIARAIAQAMNVDTLEYVRRTAAWQAERDLAGVYAPILKTDTPEAVCRRFTSIFGLMYDFGRAEIVREEPRRFHACAYGLPEPIAGWWMRASECYLAPVLDAAGARNPRIVWKIPQADGERDGTRLVRIPSETEWE